MLRHAYTFPDRDKAAAAALAMLQVCLPVRGILKASQYDETFSAEES
jgi:hypothetical protein